MSDTEQLSPELREILDVGGVHVRRLVGIIEKPTRMLSAAIAAVAVSTLLATPAHAGYEPQGGRWQADGSGPTYHEGMRHTRPTRHAVGQYQRILGVPVTYRYDRRTRLAVLREQRERAWLRNTGRIDFPTSRTLLWPTIEREAARVGMSANLLCGHLWAESRLDPGAVGPGGIDYGVAQIVARYKPGTNYWSVPASIRRMATDDQAARRAYGTWAQIAWWKHSEARRAAAGRPSAEAWAYRERIQDAPCPRGK